MEFKQILSLQTVVYILVSVIIAVELLVTGTLTQEVAHVRNTITHSVGTTATPFLLYENAKPTVLLLKVFLFSSSHELK